MEMRRETFSLRIKSLRFHVNDLSLWRVLQGQTMQVSSGGFGVKDHKTSFLQFNNPFNTIFQSHFMLSKARISAPSADMGFCGRAFVYEAVVTRSYRGPLPLVCSVPLPRPVFLQRVQPFQSNDSCPRLKWFDSS